MSVAGIFIKRYSRLITMAGLLLILVSSCSSSKKASSSSKPKTKPSASTSSPQHKSAEKKLGFTFSTSDPNKSLYYEAAKWIGTPYKYGGNTKKGVDCSGMICQVYTTVYNKKLHRTSADMAKLDVKKISKSTLRPGDLIFFATSKDKKKVTHVGLFLKNNYFIHASSKAGVVVNNLNEAYYKKTYLKSGKVK